MALLWSCQFRNARSHVARINRNALISVLSAQFMLVLHLQTIEAHKFLRRIFQSWILILRCHRFPDRIIPGHIHRGAELPQVTDRLDGNPVLIVVADTLLHNVDSRELILPLEEISDFLICQIDLDAAGREAVGSPVLQIHRIDNVFVRHRRSIRFTVFIKGLL
ncbi:hypothetical protein D3C77_566260 [compost metagenome]